MFADRGDVSKSSAEIFFRKVKFWKGEEGEEAPPVFVGILFLSILFSDGFRNRMMTYYSSATAFRLKGVCGVTFLWEHYVSHLWQVTGFSNSYSVFRFLVMLTCCSSTTLCFKAESGHLNLVLSA